MSLLLPGRDGWRVASEYCLLVVEFEALSSYLRKLPHYCKSLLLLQEYNQDAWVEIVQRCEEAGVDAFEVNFSCPHGMPERNMGMAMGQCPELVEVPFPKHYPRSLTTSAIDAHFLDCSLLVGHIPMLSGAKH